MDLKKGATELKDKLLNATNLNDIAECFMTNFGENPAWKNKGGKCKVKGLKQLITDIVSSKFKVDNPSVLASHDRKHDLVHGLLHFRGYSGMFIYMPQINKGFIAIHRSDLKDGMEYFRFTMASGHENVADILLSDDTNIRKVIVPDTPDSVQ